MAADSTHATLILELDATKSPENHVLVQYAGEAEPTVVPKKRQIVEVWEFVALQNIERPRSSTRMDIALLCLLNYLPTAGLGKQLRKNLPLSNNHFMRLAYSLTKEPILALPERNFSSIPIPILIGGLSLTCTCSTNCQFKVKPIENAFIPIPIPVDENYFCQINGQSYIQWARHNNLVGVSPMPSLFRNPSSLSSRESKLSSAASAMYAGVEKELLAFRESCEQFLTEKQELIPFTTTCLTNKELQEMRIVLATFQEQFSVFLVE